MVEIKIKVEEKDNKHCEGLVAKIIAVGLEIKGKNATLQEKEVADHYEKLFKSENKVKFVNKSKENKKEIDELIKQIKEELGI